MTAIGSCAFEGCTSLSTVTVHSETPITIASDAFPDMGNMTLVVPAGCKDAYQSAAVWRFFKNIVEMDYTDIHIPEGYYVRTFCNASPLDFTDVTGIGAYVFDMNHLKTYFDSYYDGYDWYSGEVFENRKYGTLGFKQVFQVAAGQGVLVRGMPGDYKIPIATIDVPKQEDPDGYLVGVPYDTTVCPEEGEYDNLVLAKPISKSIGFYALSHEGIISGGKAYLHIKKDMYGSYASPFPNYDEYGLAISFSDDEENQITKINSVGERKAETGQCYYDLQGRRVDHPSKGVYIKNGKKIIIK